jgi:DNA-binding CsgD family transcriptional regulator
MFESLGEPGFAGDLASFLQLIVPYDAIFVDAYPADGPPRKLHYAVDPKPVFDLQSGNQVTAYSRQAYILDPIFHACQRRVAAGVYRLRDFAPAGFFRSEYYRTFYVLTETIDEVAFFIYGDGNMPIVISVVREKGSRKFSSKDMRAFQEIEPLIRSAALRQWGGSAPRRRSQSWQGDDANPLESGIRKVVSRWKHSTLSTREMEIVGLVLTGHSTPAIARHLGISANTVKVHRRRVYEKLEISSQAQLFSLFFPPLS